MFRFLLAVSAVALVYGQTENLVQLATKLGATELVKLVTLAGLGDTLANKGPFTVFAPSNKAFGQVPKPILERLLNNKTELTDLLLYHVTNGKVLSSQLKNEQLAPSLFAKHDLRFNIYDDGKLITAEGAPVQLADQQASNGVIHVLRKVIYPIPEGSVVDLVASDADLSTLLKAVEAAKLVDTLKEGAPVQLADQQASNGVIHVLRKVIFPIPEGSVVDLVAHDAVLSTLLKAVQAAKLAETLKGGPFTLFAPTNEAFEKLPAGTLDKLLANVTALTDVLTYHVVKGTFYLAGLTNGMKVQTVEGKDVEVKTTGPGQVMINNAEVERPELSVTNGVVHLINDVLLPPSP